MEEELENEVEEPTTTPASEPTTEPSSEPAYVSDLSPLAQELKEELLFRDFPIGNTEQDDTTLERAVSRAIKEINRCRRFKATQEKPYDTKYEDMIIPLCITAFSKIGAEGQIAHGENGVDRKYTSGGDYPKEMLDEIIPLIG